MSVNKTFILSHDEIERKLERMAWEIYENNHLAKQLILIGVSDNGSFLANALAALLTRISSIRIHQGRIDMDKTQGFEARVSLNSEVALQDETIIMVDDVLNSGRTMLSALMSVAAQKPAKIQTAVLANRNHKAFPVHADIVGISLATTLQEHIWFELEPDQKMVVFLT